MKSLFVSPNAFVKAALLGTSCLGLAAFGFGSVLWNGRHAEANVIPRLAPVVAASVVTEAATVTAATTQLAAATATADADWGTIKGKIVLQGKLDALKPLIKKGDASAKDSSVCAAEEVPDESVVVDPKTGGIANVVVYLQKKPTKVHPDLAKAGEKEVVFDQKNCRFLPHVLLVRTDQQVRVKSDDAVAHNTHTYPLKNKQENFVVAASDRTGIAVPSVTLVERLPHKVGCDIHPWMQAYWVVLDHSYAAVTKEDGSFEIKNLPVGEHTFVVWQEKVGYINKEFKVKVKAGDNELEAVKVSATSLTK